MIPIWLAPALAALGAVLSEGVPQIVLYHGGRWQGAPQILPPKKGRAEHGAGIYLTTSWSRAKSYAKGGGVVYQICIDPPQKWAEHAFIPLEEVEAFLVRTFGRGRTGKELLEACRRVSSRTNGFVQASSLIAIVVNADASSGNKGPLLADFLSSLGIGASHVRQSDEDWVVLFDPRLVRSVHRLTPADVNEPGFLFDRPFERPRP